MSFIADQTAGRIGENLIPNPRTSRSRGPPLEEIFPKFPFFKKNQKRGDNSKNLFSVKKATRGQTVPGLSASIDIIDSSTRTVEGHARAHSKWKVLPFLPLYLNFLNAPFLNKVKLKETI